MAAHNIFLDKEAFMEPIISNNKYSYSFNPALQILEVFYNGQIIHKRNASEKKSPFNHVVTLFP